MKPKTLDETKVLMLANGDEVRVSDIIANMEPAHMVNILTAYVNRYGITREAQMMALVIEEAHCTLQAEVVRLFIQFLLQYKPRGIDQRNAAAAHMCNQLRELSLTPGALQTEWPMV
jgi:hypothetical protein